MLSDLQVGGRSCPRLGVYRTRATFLKLGSILELEAVAFRSLFQATYCAEPVLRMSVRPNHNRHRGPIVVVWVDIRGGIL